MSQDSPQQIRFCSSADGTRLAVATFGKGPPLVKAATWLTHVEKDPHNLFTRHWVSELSREVLLKDAVCFKDIQRRIESFRE